MEFTKWIVQSGKKKIVTDCVKNANTLIRKVNRERNRDISDVSVVTLQQIAEELLLAMCALQENEEVEIVSFEKSVYILDEILQETKYEFVPEECYCIRTSEVIMQSLNQIRMNDVTESYQNSQDFKINELKNMIMTYEECLRERHMFDYPLLLQETFYRMKKLVESVNGKEMLQFCLPWIAKCQLGILEDMEFTALEEKFLNILTQIAGVIPKKLEFFLENENEEKVKYDFFKAYGIVNEIRYVMNQIVEKELPYGAVNLFYTSPIYENFIRSAFESREILYQFITGESATTSYIIQFMIAVLDWAESDFLYEKLRVIVENPLMTFEKLVLEEKIQNLEQQDAILKNPITCFNRILRTGIGWSIIRYQDCILRIKEDKEEYSKYQYFLTFLEDLTAIFERKLNCGELYARLVEITLKYTFSQSKERRYIKPLLMEQKEIFNQAATKSAIPLIRERLQKLNIKKEFDNGKVNILKVQNLEVLERPYQFVIGLSAKQFMADTTQSPVLSDDELKRYLAGKVLFAAEAGNRVRENLQRTFHTLEEGYIVLGYSTFDTIELKENAPSVFYSDYYECFGKKKQLAECGYDIFDSGIKISSEIWQKKLELLEIPKESHKVFDKEDNSVIEMSASALQTLIDCPLRYYYRYVQMLPSREFLEKQEYRWLSSKDKGNLFHHTMEQYCNRVLMSEVISEVQPNKNIFQEIYEKEVEGLLQEVPYTSVSMFQVEKEEERGKIWQYLQDFQEQLYHEHQLGKAWRVLACELAFKNVKYIVKNPDNSNEDLEIFFHGSIDRLDGYVDENNKLHIRIIDYKTGDMENKEKEIKKHSQIQHFVYAMAALEYVIKNYKDLVTVFHGNMNGISSICCQYIFPYEKKEERILDVTKYLNEAFTENGYRFPNDIDSMLWESMAKKYMTEYVKKLEFQKNEELETCKYCSYIRQCRRKLGVEW